MTRREAFPRSAAVAPDLEDGEAREREYIFLPDPFPYGRPHHPRLIATPPFTPALFPLIRWYGPVPGFSRLLAWKSCESQCLGVSGSWWYYTLFLTHPYPVPLYYVGSACAGPPMAGRPPANAASKQAERRAENTSGHAEASPSAVAATR